MRDQNISSKFTVYESSEELSDSEKGFLLQAIEAREKAYAPYSEFYVGASVILDDGSVFAQKELPFGVPCHNVQRVK